MAHNPFNWRSKRQQSGKSKTAAAQRRRRIGSFRRLSLGVEWLEDRRLLAAGDLDTTFGIGGQVVQDLGLGKNEEIFASAVQSDGKMVVAGFAINTAGAGRDFLVARFNTNGTLDTSFGTGGSVIVNVSDPGPVSTPNYDDQVNDLIIQSDGSIIAVGTATKNVGLTPFTAVGIIKLTSSGVLDTTFDGDGKASTILKNNANANAHVTSISTAAVQADGKIVVGGKMVAGSTEGDYVVARYTPSGSLDVTFDGDGYTFTDFDSTLANNRDDDLLDLTIQPDGKILAVGRSESTVSAHQVISIARYNPNGSIDTTFGGGDGKVWTDISPSAFSIQSVGNAVELEPDGQFIVGGTSAVRAGQFAATDNEMVVARYNANGTLDTSFASSSEVPGTLRINFGLSDFGNDMIIQPQPDGKYIVGGDIGASGAANDFALARITLNGQLDTSFSGDGKTQTHFAGTTFTRLNDIVMQPDGKIVASGYVVKTGSLEDIAMARFESGLVLNSISGLAQVNEGATYTLNLSSTNPSTILWTINWGDGNVQVVPGNPSTVTHVYADGPLNTVITATITNSSGTFPVNNRDISVLNVAPSLAINQPSVAVNEGQTATNSGTFGDVAADTVTIVASIGTITQSAGVWNWSYNSTDDLNQPVIITATDEDGGITTSSFNFKVHNVAPTITVDQSSVSVSQGGTAMNSGTFGDVPADTVTIVASIGTITQTGNTWSWSYNTSSGLPPQTVTIAAIDDNTGRTALTFNLAITPNLTAAGDQSANEGSTVSITDIGTFTDVVQGGDAGPAVGLDANDFAAIGAFDPIIDVVFNTDTLAISGGFTGVGTTVMANAGFGAFQIAVFAFSTFQLDAGVRITAVGSRPLAILSQGDMAVDGIIDVSAISNASVSATLVDTPGAGGGAGGDGVPPRHGDPAAGAPTLAGGQLGPGGPLGGASGSGGGSGGAGGHGEVFGSPSGVGGVDYVNLQLAIQGGSGGSASGRNSSNGFNILGGAGGGGIELGAANSVIISSTGQVLANGSNGRDGFLGATGGGGGGGGNILVHGTNVANSGLLSAKGGNGGTGIHTGGGGAGGDILFSTSNVGTFADNGTKVVSGGNGGGVAATAGEAGDFDHVIVGQTATPIYETFDYVIDWGDGSPAVNSAATIDTPGVNVGDVVHGSFDGSHTYADNGVFTVTITVNDSHGGSNTKSLLVTVNNLNPTLTVDQPSVIVNEGQAATNSGTFGDVAADTVNVTASVGTVTFSGGVWNWSYNAADDVPAQTVTITASDEDGGSSTVTFNLAVNNLNPTLTVDQASVTIDEGQTAANSGTFGDVPADTVAIVASIGVVSFAGGLWNWSYNGPDGLTNQTVTITATDEDGGSTDVSFNLTVNNVAPTLVLSGGSGINEGSSYTLNLSSSDPGADTITQWTINWGDTTEIVSGNPASVSHTYADGDASYVVTATAMDEDGTYAAGNTVAVAVHNVAPTLTISGAASVNEGSTYSLSLSTSDPGADAITQWTINWGDSVEVVSGNPASASHTYADGSANYTISATATDEDGTYAANTVDVTVLNVTPTLVLSGAAAVDEGSGYTLNLSSTDPGADTISQWTINWGDGIEVVIGNPASLSHTYADGAASYTISATATDEDGAYAAGNTVAVTVNNVAPTLAISGAASVNEGSSYTLNLSAADPGSDTIAQWTINWGDSIEVVSGNPANVSHTYADGTSNYTISATATDEDGTFSASNTVAVTVNNVAPTLAISGAASVNEGSAYTLNLSSTDPGVDTITQWTINWGDSIQVVTGNPTSVSHTYADGTNNYTISATATDEDGTHSAGNTVSVAVANVAPTVAISGASSVSEGSSYTLNLSSSDPGADTITQWTINWGDSIQVVSGNAASVSHTYADGTSNYVISATATDEDGTYSAGNTVSVTVNNVAPTLAISGAATVNEGSTYTLNLSSSDPGADTIAQWTINWGDSTQVVTGNPSSITHVYADGSATRTISATATDEDGTYAAGNTVTVAVANVAPTLAISGAANVNEGSTYTLNLSSSDSGADTITQWTINWGDNTQVVTGNPSSVTHVYTDGNVSSHYTISATATDEDGTFAAGNTVAVNVINVAPTANAGGPYATFDDAPITLTGTGADPAGAADPLTYKWDLDGDGVFGETGSGATRGNEVGANVTYNPAGLPTSTQTVKLQVSDGDGGVTVATSTVQILGQGTLQIGGTLYIIGGNSNDIVAITQCDNTIYVLATFNSNNPLTFNASTITDIQVRTRGGNDIVITTSNVMATMTIDGGAGNDLLTGGGGRNVIFGGTGNDILYGAAGNDILLGGDGNDDLFGGDGNDVIVGGNGNDILNGGSGRDVMIGSQDNDSLDGGNDEDVLIGGITIHDNNTAALDAVMAIWGSSASFSSRVATLTSSGGLLQAGVAVFDDDDNDQLVGNAGRDLYFGDNNPSDHHVDMISLQALQDQLIAVT